MRLEAEGRKPIEAASEGDVTRTLRSLRSYGPVSFASLTDEEGDYVQVAGGGIGCMLEKREAATCRHLRAYGPSAHPVYSDGTRLAFAGGEVPLRSDEWLKIGDVEQVFLAFLTQEPLPAHVLWRDISDVLERAIRDD